MQVVFARFAVEVGPAAAGVLVMLLIILWRRKTRPAYLFCTAVFGIYGLFALAKAFFPIHISGDDVEIMREVRFSQFINAIPLNFNLSEMPDLVYMQMVQNVLLTLPFGFGVNFVARLRTKDFMWLIPLVGLGVETAQLLIGLILRYPYRVIDINDALLNAFGVLLGYGLFRVFAALYLSAAPRLALTDRGLTAYLYEVAIHASTVKSETQ